MKILAVCQAGNVRSVALAWNLKGKGHEAIAVGHATSSPATLKMLSKWADKVLLAQPHFFLNVPPEARKKAIVVNLGPDVWKDPTNPSLKRKVSKLLEEKGL